MPLDRDGPSCVQSATLWPEIAGLDDAETIPELEEAALADVLDGLADPLLVLDREGRVVHTNEAADTHWSAMPGTPWLDLVEADQRMHAEAALETARDHSKANLQLQRGGRSWSVSVQPSHAGLVVLAHDLGDLAQERDAATGARAEMEEALREIDHRVRNLFAILPAIVKLSLRRNTDMKSARAGIVGRISALASAHAVTLTLSAIRDGITLDAMIQSVLLIDEDPRFVTSGPPVHLATRGSNTVALTLHELASNSAKFGALSSPDGKVRIAWAIESSARDTQLPASARNVLRLLWSETGGPQLDGPPEHRGFGTEVVDRLIASQSGTIEREWLLHGLDVTIDLPLYELGQEPKLAGDLRGTPTPLKGPAETKSKLASPPIPVLGEPDPAPAAPAAQPLSTRPTGPSESEILGQLERIIRRAGES